MADKKPFHKSIVGLLERTECMTTFRAHCDTILCTEIPKDHDAVIAALRAAESRLRFHDSAFIQRVVESIEADRSKA